MRDMNGIWTNTTYNMDQHGGLNNMNQITNGGVIYGMWQVWKPTQIAIFTNNNSKERILSATIFMVIFHWHCHGDLTINVCVCVSINQNLVDLSMEIAYFCLDFTKKTQIWCFFFRYVCHPIFTWQWKRPA